MRTSGQGAALDSMAGDGTGVTLQSGSCSRRHRVEPPRRTGLCPDRGARTRVSNGGTRKVWLEEES